MQSAMVLTMSYWNKRKEARRKSMFFNPRYKFGEITKLSNILNKYHIDYNNLIPMGLANDATGLSIY